MRPLPKSKFSDVLLPLRLYDVEMLGRYGDLAAFVADCAASSAACACFTVGPAKAISVSAALSSTMRPIAAVSAGRAVTTSAVPTRRESDALAPRRLLSAVRSARRALPTWMALRRESLLVAAPARTLAVDDLSCSAACSSWRCDALWLSRAASTAKYCCFTCNATVYRCEISLASAASTLASAALRLNQRRPPSKSSRLVDSPREYDQGAPLYGTSLPWKKVSPPALLPEPETWSVGMYWPYADRTAAAVVRSALRACTVAGALCWARRTASSSEMARAPSAVATGDCWAARANGMASTSAVARLITISSPARGLSGPAAFVHTRAAAPA